MNEDAITWTQVWVIGVVVVVWAMLRKFDERIIKLETAGKTAEADSQ